SVPHDNGNIIVRSAAAKQGQNETDQKGLAVTVHSNPAAGQFVLTTRSASTELLRMKVVDNLGRLVESRQGIAANGVIYLGNRFLPGIYFVELEQGSHKQTLRLVKAGK
ncbi:MAG TPA: T9SS type A sorting domain-containing protein, partial [Flavisolibacter sp.]|nr:T9SS type A sorting domain-containing protein [Flavisolibacter sp.]